MLAYLKATILMAAMLLLPGAMAQDTKGLDPTYPTRVSNQNVWKMYADYQIMLEEMDKSVTKQNAGTLSHDAARWQAYISGMRSYVAYWQTQQFLDLPVTHGRDWDVSDPLNPPCTFKDNTSTCELMALVVSARDELVLSASAGIPVHLYPADLTRQEQYWTAMEGYITYMQQNSPLDEPVTAAEENLGLKPGFDNSTP